ncbi:MAG: dTDP-4-dehydrorhamnose reductase [Mycobacteriales bacterium]|jgi:dTDP-4-dehydrorhamnose reductase
MRRLLITGGTGYLGAELVRLAPAAGWDVTATHLRTEPADPGVHWQRLDVTDAAAVADAIRTVAPDAVVHTAYLREGPDAEAVTVDGAVAVAVAARAAGARLVALSTDVVFGGDRVGRYTEDDAARPVSAYGAAKLAAEAAVARVDPHALLVRTSLLYGGPAPGPHEEAALEVAQGEREATFFTDEVRCPTQVGDIAAALLELVRTDAAGPLHVAGSDAVSRYEFARLVATAAGLPAGRLRGGLSGDAGLVRPRNCALDCTRAGRLVTAPPRGVYEVLGVPAPAG